MINDRVDLLIKEVSNSNKRAFAQIINVSPTVIENIVGKRKGKPSFDVIEKMAFAIENINMDWLITGRGSMWKKDEECPNPQPPCDSSMDCSIYYNMYKEKDGENKILIEEIGALKERVRMLEEKNARLELIIASGGQPAMDVQNSNVG